MNKLPNMKHVSNINILSNFDDPSHEGPCDPSPCLNGGDCTVDPGGGHICDCASGYGGMSCQTDTSSEFFPVRVMPTLRTNIISALEKGFWTGWRIRSSRITPNCCYSKWFLNPRIIRAIPYQPSTTSISRWNTRERGPLSNRLYSRRRLTGQ